MQRCLSIGMKAPDFTAKTTFGPLKLADLAGKWVVLFSHPGDFTPVCTTEFIAFSQYYPLFLQKNVHLIGLSIDSNPAHLAWVHDIYRITGIQIPFPVIADRDGAIAQMYGMIASDISTTETVRTVFIIDEKQIIRAILNYPLTNGRNIPEILRLVEALQTTDREKVATPANWLPGQPVLIPPPQTYAELLEREQCPAGLYCIAWYLCYKQI
ncbi:MAG: peroxiredoxin [Peptococcaceae bacterium]